MFQPKPSYTSRPSSAHRSPRKSSGVGPHMPYPNSPLRSHRPIPAPPPYMPTYAMPYRDYGMPMPSYPRMAYPPAPPPVSMPGLPYHWPTVPPPSRVTY